MVRSVLIFLFPTLILAYSSGLAQRSNQEFCASGIDSLAVEIVADLNAGDYSPLIVSDIEGRFGDVLRSRLAARLMERGIDVFLTGADGRGTGKYQLQSTINEYSLKYVGSGGSLFRQGKVAREFAISATCCLVEGDGKLVKAFDRRSLVHADTLSLEQARKARGSDMFLSPALPPTTFQRLIEPGIIAGVTGVLVYLFFASR